VGSQRAAVLAVTVVSGVVTFIFASVLAALPQLQFAYNGTSLHVALETAASLIALLVGQCTIQSCVTAADFLSVQEPERRIITRPLSAKQRLT
jgi:uncharacterized PurR-regulated membrane protein YhhQ (DUF165 family)